ncbi:MAG: sulfur carrier protein ThiS [Thermosynechococcaceae cyanobacterium]
MMTSSNQIQVQVNGQETCCAVGQYLPDLLAQLKLNPRLIAIEYNGEILHRQFWDTQPVANGDRLEIVTIVGGG